VGSIFGSVRFLLPVCRLGWFLYTLNIYKCMLNVYKNQQNRQTGSRNLMGPKTLPTIWGTYMKLVTKYQISAINSWSYIWSQASYRYTILWVAFLDPSDSYFLFADLVGFYTHWTYIKMLPTIWYTYMMLVTKYKISAINSYWEKCDEKYLGRTEGQMERGKTVYPPTVYAHF
jgi:hypothetical protein